MKTILLSLILVISSASFAIEKSNYPTKYENTGHYNGAPWANGTWKRTSENVVGACEDYGRVYSEIECYNAAKKDGYEYYQITDGNHVKIYHGSLWDKTSYDYLKCFGCH